MAKFIVGCIAGSVFTMAAIVTVFVLGTVGGDGEGLPGADVTGN